jgi:hypothetical protein
MCASHVARMFDEQTVVLKLQVGFDGRRGRADNPVSPMYGHSAVMYENSMAVFGGTYMSGSPPAMDLEKRSGQGRAVCILQLEIWQWVCPWSQGTEVDHTRPRGSAFHSAVLASDGRTTQMIIYGGVRWNVTTNDFTVHNEVGVSSTLVGPQRALVAVF